MSGMHRNRLDDRPPVSGRVRAAIQAGCAALFNGYAAGFAGGRIFTGKSKAFCVPVLNCYSCPGALGACPIGSLQAVIGQRGGRFPFYVLGLLMLFGVVLGRLVCGLLCPFGAIQDLLDRISRRKIALPKKLDRALRYLKYAVLIIMVLLLPAIARDRFGMSDPWFCKYICPAGTLEAGLPLTLLNGELRSMTGGLFLWKAAVLALVIAGSIFIPRFFCKYLCPLGAFYSLFNRFSAYRMSVDRSRCINCGRCEKACPMTVDVTKDANSPECIRCGKCAEVCPAKAVRCSFSLNSVKQTETSKQ